MLSLRDIGKQYEAAGVRTTALNRVNLTITPGEFLAVMGPSGSGKSTLLSVLAMLENPSSGDYLIQGRSVADAKAAKQDALRNRLFSIIFQDFLLIDSLSVEENVALPLLYRRRKAAERRRLARQLIERVGLGNRQSHFPRHLSGGQKQRVAIARALVTNPQFIFADEPTGNLDSENSENVLDLLQELNAEGVGIFMVTHSKSDAARASKRLYMQDGSLV